MDTEITYTLMSSKRPELLCPETMEIFSRILECISIFTTVFLSSLYPFPCPVASLTFNPDVLSETSLQGRLFLGEIVDFQMHCSIGPVISSYKNVCFHLIYHIRREIKAGMYTLPWNPAEIKCSCRKFFGTSGRRVPVTRYP